MPRWAVVGLFALSLCNIAGLGGAVEIVAHRGASHDAPENTMAAFKLAWQQNCDICELDIYLSKDHKVVVIHDKDTKRLAGVDKTVISQTLDELRKLDVGRRKGEQFAGEKIPELAEVLKTVPAGKRLFIEVKTGPEIVPELNRVLIASKLPPQQTPIISFKSEVIAAMKKLRPDIAGYWVVSPKKDAPASVVNSLIETAKACHADGIDVAPIPTMDATFVEKIHAAGLKCYVWTIDDAAKAKHLAAIGVDGITTNRPGWLREQLEAGSK